MNPSAGECEKCRAWLVSAEDGKPLDESTFEVETVNRVWAVLRADERAAIHRAKCLGLEDPADVDVARAFVRCVYTLLALSDGG